MTNVNNHQEEKKGLSSTKPGDEKISYQPKGSYPREEAITESSKDQTNIKGINGQVDKVFGQDLKWYAKIFGWPIIILIVAEIFLEVNTKRYFPLLADEKIWGASLFLRWLVFAFIAIYALKKVKTSLPQLIVSCLSGAFMAGIALSIFQLFWYSGLWTIFNIIGLPLLMMFESCLIAILIYGLLKLIK